MIDWGAFIVVVVVALVASSALVTLFSVALRFSDGAASWSRPASIALFVLCGLLVVFGIYLIVPSLHLF